MTSLLSAISGHFNRALIFGTVVPVLMFMTLGAWLIESWLPMDAPWRALAAWGAEWQAAIAFLAVALASGILYSVNVPLTRVYEGYPWQDSFIGQRRVAKYRRQRQVLSARWSGYRTLRYAIEGNEVLASAAAEIAGVHSEIGRMLVQHFPTDPFILPSRLGNTIRAFEMYPQQQYGISAIHLWPRLIAVVDAEYSTAIAEQKTSFDFMLNSSALSLITAAMLAVIGLTFPVPFASTRWLAVWTVEMLALVALGYWFYEGAISRAFAWGFMVKGAFDLYRHALLKKLGYDASPQTRQAERNLWEAISHQIIFGDTRRVRVPPLVEPATCVEVNPDWLSMTIHRSVDPPDATGRQRVYLRVTNSDASQRPAKSVVLVERLPTNAELVHDSMTPPVWVEGINPVRILLGPMGAKETASIRFDIVRHKD